ncbi:8547_t:CDS:2, partial [Acaulospora morrowiae]
MRVNRLKSILFTVPTCKQFNQCIRPNEFTFVIPSREIREFQSSPSRASSSKKGVKTEAPIKVVSSVPAGTILKGINIFKGGSDPISKLDEEYPDWLWELLDEEKQNASRENQYSRSYHRYQRKQLIKNNNFDR